MNIIHWVGTAAFIICFLPQVIKTIIDNNADGISLLFLIIILIGEVCYTIAIIHDYGLVWWMLANYFSNILLASVVLYYKVRK